MPAIWNVGNSNGYNDKKISSKLTFEEGETFKGTIVGKGSGDENNNIVVRLTDGWQFSAELLDGAELEGQRLVKFKVEGLEDGKLKLRIVNDLNNGSEEIDDDIVKDFMQKQGMQDKDFSILKSMVKFNLALTKENIDFVRSVFNFKERINTKEGIADFIDKYILGKGIDSGSQEALNIKNTLIEFFNAFKEMNQDDILLFLENGIDINKENIESYNKLFKSDMNLKEYFDNVYKDFKQLNFKEGNSLELNSSNDKVKEDIEPKNIELKQGFKYSQTQNAGLKIYDESTSNKSRVSLLNLLKTMTGNEDNMVKDTVKDILLENRDIFKGVELNNIFNKLDNMSEDEIKNIFKNFSENEGLTKESMSAALKEIVGGEIQLSDKEAAQLKEVLNFKNNTENLNNNEQMIKNQGESSKNSDNTLIKNQEQMQENKGIFKDSLVREDRELGKSVLHTNEKMTTSNIVRHEINSKVQDIKDVIKQIMSHSEEFKSRSLESKVAEFIKSNINDFKLFNSMSNEYYYMDVPIRKNENEYPCKLIIKDDRKKNKKIDSSNVKMVVAVKTINMGTVDAYLTVLGETLKVDIKCTDKFVKLLSKGTNQLSEKLSNLGYLVNINVSEKANEVNLTSCREFFNDGNTATLDTKV